MYGADSLREKQTVTPLTTKLFFYGTKNSITVLATARHWTTPTDTIY
jgi:hypothetical protein